MKLPFFGIILILSGVCSGCIKTSERSGSASFNIVNGINGNSSILTNFEPIGPKQTPATSLQYFSQANQIAYANYWESGSYIGAISLSLFQYPDSVNILWSGSFTFKSGTIHTLYLGGDTTSVDTLLSTDQIPYYPMNDSVSGVRFVNMVQGSQPMSINLTGNSPTQTEFSNIVYKQISDFRQYAANSMGPGSYFFEIRDQASDSLLTTCQWSCAIFKNNTIVIVGSEKATFQQPIQAVIVNNY